MPSTMRAEPESPERAPHRRLYRLFIPVPSKSRLARGVELVAFGLGYALGFVWLDSIAGVGAVIAAGTVGAVAYFGATAARSRHLRWIFVGWLVASYLAIAYFWVALTAVLAWTLPLAVVLVASCLLALSVAGTFDRWRFARTPLCLPLGVWIASLLGGWLHEDGLVRCDDYLSVRSDDSLRVVVLTSTELSGCRPGEVLRIGRYPRNVWQSPDGRDLVFTTQPGIGFLSTRPPVADTLSGSICSAPVDGARRPTCLGDGKAQAIVESERHDRLFVAAWGRFADGSRGVIYAVTRRPPLEQLAEARLDVQSGEMFHDEHHDTLGVFSDEGKVMLSMNAASLRPVARVEAPILPGDVRYEPSLGEGVLCAATGPLKPIGGVGYASVAFRTEPLSLRPLAPAGAYPSSWLALTWGCDWDPATRRVYVAVANFGLLLDIDYDSGSVVDRSWIGFGARSVEHDRNRGRIYIANFLSGTVREVDVADARVLREWFVGRFVRGLTLARDGGSLFAASNVGVVRVAL